MNNRKEEEEEGREKDQEIIKKKQIRKQEKNIKEGRSRNLIRPRRKMAGIAIQSSGGNKTPKREEKRESRRIFSLILFDIDKAVIELAICSCSWQPHAWGRGIGEEKRKEKRKGEEEQWW